MLLEARKSAPLERLYAWYGRRLLRRAFVRVRAGGAAWPQTTGPTIALLNHSAWWDPIVALFLSHDLFRRDGYGIMDATQLERYPFFRRIGCFGLADNRLDTVRQASRYAEGLLRAGRSRTLWIFPQGALLPARVPLRFRSGAARLARAVPEAPVVPLALRYVLRTDQRPELFVRVGPPIEHREEPATTLTRRFENALGAELAQLDGDLERDILADYRTVLTGRASVSGLYDRLRGNRE